MFSLFFLAQIAWRQQIKQIAIEIVANFDGFCIGIQLYQLHIHTHTSPKKLDNSCANVYCTIVSRYGARQRVEGGIATGKTNRFTKTFVEVHTTRRAG